MKKKFCHLIVGFSIFNYFKNLLLSTLELDKKSDIIVITTGNPNLFGWGGFFDYEFKESKKIERLVNELKVKFKRDNIYYYEITAKNSVDEKVGGLYQAYNFGLKKAIEKKIDFLNIMQNDSQLMLWSPQILEIIDEIFNSQKDIFFISPAFFRKTTNLNIEHGLIRRKIFLKSFNTQKNIKLSNKSAVGDWGIFDISKLRKLNFKFQLNENFMSKYYFEKGFKLAYCLIPFVTLLPWPVTVRQGRIKGSILPLKHDKYLKLSENINEIKLFNTEFAWKEDCVKPNNWWGLEPNWVTDFNLEYFKLVFKIIRKNKDFSGICYSNNCKKRYIYPPSLLTPHRPEILKEILVLPYNFLIKIIHKIIKLIKKKN